jgi:hypothetical protein
VGLKEGAVMRINTLELEQRVKYEGIINNSITNMLQIKSKNWLVLAHPTALTVYSDN